MIFKQLSKIIEGFSSLFHTSASVYFTPQYRVIIIKNEYFFGKLFVQAFLKDVFYNCPKLELEIN